jgi:hypothetical protein
MLNLRNASACAVAAGVALATAAVGCERNPTYPQAVSGTGPSEGVTNAQNAATERVVDRLAYARCDHEQMCNNIGNGRKYATRDVCMDQVRGNANNDLNAYNCPRGINRGAFNACISALRSGQCNFSLDTISRENDCRSGTLCMR